MVKLYKTTYKSGKRVKVGMFNEITEGLNFATKGGKKVLKYFASGNGHIYGYDDTCVWEIREVK